MRISPHTPNSFDAQRAETRDDAARILGADWVARLLAAPNARGQLRARRAGAWDANRLPELSAYEVLLRDLDKETHQ